jgi:hypothetical protein
MLKFSVFCSYSNNIIQRQLVDIFHKYSDLSEEPPAITKLTQIKVKSKSSVNNSSSDSSKSIERNKKSKDTSGEAVEDELEEARQREHLQRTIATLKHKLSKVDESRYIENTRIMDENVVLLT